MNLDNKFYKLLNEYDELKDKIMDYNENFHDGMYYDIQGYSEIYQYELETDEERTNEIETLNKQVKACRMLLKGLESLKYTYC
tara:strand:- start:386 stop:634 length:249 start_codon:yes stop_codon:yes gene_type:complete